MDEKTKHYVRRAIDIHGTTYDYSLIVDWAHYEAQAKIVCPIHGEFIQSVRTHVQKKCGCPRCGKVAVGRHNASNLQVFLEKARDIHGDRYDYGRVVSYTNNTTKVEIGCPIHGYWQQAPAKHIARRATGCPRCAGKLMDTDEFVRRAREVHGSVYDYSECYYKRANLKIVIRCAIHGNFTQTPNNHLQGYGCKRCAEEANPGVYSELYFRINKALSKQPALLYLIRFRSESNTFLKIGITKHSDVRKRIGNQFAGYQTEVLAVAKGALLSVFRMEQSLHATLVQYNIPAPKGLRGRGGTECFSDCPAVVSTFNEAVQYSNQLTIGI